MATLRANHAVQVAHGADVEAPYAGRAAAATPGSRSRRARASHGRTGEGWFDGYGLLRAFRAKAIAQRAPSRRRSRGPRCGRRHRGPSAAADGERSPMCWSTPPAPGRRVSPPWRMLICRSGRGRARCSRPARPPCPAAHWSSTPRASGSAPRAATSSPAPCPAGRGPRRPATGARPFPVRGGDLAGPGRASRPARAARDQCLVHHQQHLIHQNASTWAAASPS